MSAAETGKAFAGRAATREQPRQPRGSSRDLDEATIVHAHDVDLQDADVLAEQIANLGSSIRANLEEFESLPSLLRQRLDQQHEDTVRAVVEASDMGLSQSQNPIWQGVGRSQGVAQVSGSPEPETFSMTVHPVMPPAADIADKILQMSSQGQHTNVQNRLVQSWAWCHTIRKHEQCAKIPDSRNSFSHITMCRRASVFLCGEAQRHMIRQAPSERPGNTKRTEHKNRHVALPNSNHGLYPKLISET